MYLIKCKSSFLLFKSVDLNNKKEDLHFIKYIEFESDKIKRKLKSNDNINNNLNFHIHANVIKNLENTLEKEEIENYINIRNVNKNIG
jgi:hypothetical protein